MRRKAGPIAIDFGSYALRMMQLGGDDRRTEVIAAACHVYASPARGAAHEPGEIIEALRSVLRGNKFVGRQTVSALGERRLLVKNIRLPEMPEVDLASAARFEAGERITGPDDDAEVRFIPAGFVAADTESQQEVIVLAAPALVVRQHLELLSEAGLESAGIDAAACALFRPFERYLGRSEDEEQVNVFVDVGWSGSRIIITRGNRIVFTRWFEVGGAAFDRLVAGSLSLEPAKVGELRRQIAEVRSGGDKRGSKVDAATTEAVNDAVRPAWEKLGREISLCLRYYGVTFRGARPDAVTCVGGESLSAHGLEFLSEVIGLSCRVGSPLRKMTFGDAVSSRTCPSFHEDRGPMADWATALGLSMKPVRSALKEVG